MVKEDSKMGLLAILGKPKKEEKESDDPKLNAVKGLREALDDGSDQDVLEALETVISMCSEKSE